MNNIDLTISIVSYNNKNLLKECLTSIYENSEGVSYEIIVVDNNSSDGSADVVRVEFPEIKLIVNKENVGFARANNQAIKKSRGRYVLLLNSDTVIVSDALAKMANFMENYPQAGVVGCRKLNSDLTVQPSIGMLPSAWTTFLSFFSIKWLLVSPKKRKLLARFLSLFLGRSVRSYLDWYREDDGKVRSVDFVTGACFLIRRETIEQVGLLDEKFFMYLEDADWCLRIKQAGWGVYIYEGAQVIHRVGKTFRQGGDIVSPERCKSRYYYFRKHHGRNSGLLLKIIISSALLLRGIGLLSLYLFCNSRKKNLIKRRLKSYGQVIKLDFAV